MNKGNQITITFVCSDNIARSLIGEYCLKDYIKKNNIKDIKVISAGTNTSTDASGFCFAHFEELLKMGMDVSKHKRTQLTQEVVDKSDIIISMAEYHQQWIKEKFNVYAPMFSEIINGQKTSFHIPSPDTKECEIVLRKTVHDIYESMPTFIAKMREWIKTRPSCGNLIEG